MQAVRKDWTAALNQSLVLGLLPEILRQFLHSYQCFQSLGPAVLGQRTQRRERFPPLFTCPALQLQRCAPCLMAAIENHVMQHFDGKGAKGLPLLGVGRAVEALCGRSQWSSTESTSNGLSMYIER